MDVRLRHAFLVALLSVLATPGSAGDVLRIYLARHGQTEWNAAGRMQGSADVHLEMSADRRGKSLGG